MVQSALVVPDVRVSDNIVCSPVKISHNSSLTLLRFGSLVALTHHETASELQDIDISELPFSPLPCSHQIANSGNKGLGIFAVSSIARGDLIINERPLIVYPQLIPYHYGLSSGRGYTELEDAISYMPSENQQAFYALMNSHPSEPSSIKGIIDTNALYIGALPGSAHQYAAVCKDISRINHSCSPNAVYRFDLRTFSFELRALFPISPGEEIFISYIDPALPLSSRQRELSSYGFTCFCEYCSLSGPALAQSEARRSLIARADGDADARNATLERWARTPSMSDDCINCVDRMYMDLFEKEQLYYEPVWEGFAVRLCKVCCAAEDREGARRWAALAAALNLAYTGDDRGWTAVEEDPERSEWWGLRRRALMSDTS